MTFPVSKKTGTNTHGDWPKRIADFKAISNKSPAVLVNAQADALTDGRVTRT